MKITFELNELTKCLPSNCILDKEIVENTIDEWNKNIKAYMEKNSDLTQSLENAVKSLYKTGTYKYIVGYNRNLEKCPLRVYVIGYQENIEEHNGIVDFNFKYKVRTSDGNVIGWLKSDEIFDTKEDLLKHIGHES